jgi:hypothetical protein
MRIPVKSETDAFRLALGLSVVIGAAIVVGLLAGGLYGVVLFGGAVVGAMAWELRTEDPERSESLRDAASAAPVDEGHHGLRVLVIANETVGGHELRSEILQGGRRPAELRVVCPILPTRAHLIASDIDRELADARKRLEGTLEWARVEGLEATGQASADTPLAAAADELRRFRADEVIVSTHPPERSRWLESGLVERLQAELDIPVRHVVVDVARQTVGSET